MSDSAYSCSNDELKKYLCLLVIVHISKQKSLEMNIIDMGNIDSAFVIELHDDIKETGLNCAFVLSESFVLQGT